ncbi:hypothetical protein [Lactobacillus taiwanensis]|jgi:hypothetical protein|uniref:hypothetical protein n=1 Tax=Lactobacillus taiwanensis TaxID=508451 RepID=UPI00243168C1|nr:hypothetical protein [Lactobacillus taiwanensis]
MNVNNNLSTEDWSTWRNKFQKQNVENYIRLRDDFDFQKSMAVLILTGKMIDNKSNNTLQNALEAIQKRKNEAWVKEMIKLICTDPELVIMF